MQKRYKSLLSDTIIFGIGTLGSKILLFLLVPLYTTYLSTEEYGTADLVITIGQMLLPIISLAIYDAILPFGLDKSIKKEDVLKCAIFVFFIGVTVLLIIIPLSFFYKAIYPWKWYVFSYVVVSFANILLLNYLKVCDKNRIYAAIAILNAAMLVIFNLYFLRYLDLGVKGYLLSSILSIAICDIVAIIWGKILSGLKTGKLNRELLKSMILYSMPLIANAVSWWIIQSSNKVLIQVLGSTAILGLFTVATKIPSLLNIITTIFNQAWGISAIKEYSSKEEASFYSSVFRKYIIVIFMACIILVTILKPFMKIYVSDDFYVSWKIVPLLLLGACFSAISSFCGALYGTVRKSKEIMVTTIIACIVNIVINLIFIPIIGAYGAALGVLLSYVVISIIRMRDVRKIVDIDYSLGLFIPLSLIVLLQCVLATFDLAIYWTSAITLVTALALSYNDLKGIVSSILNK